MFCEGEGGRGRRCWCWRYMSRGGPEGSVSCVGHRRKGLAPLGRLRLPPPHWQERPATHCPSRVVVLPAANPPPPALPPRGSFAGAIRPFLCRRCHKSARGEKERKTALFRSGQGLGRRARFLDAAGSPSAFETSRGVQPARARTRPMVGALAGGAHASWRAPLQRKTDSCSTSRVGSLGPFYFRGL